MQNVYTHSCYSWFKSVEGSKPAVTCLCKNLYFGAGFAEIGFDRASVGSVVLNLFDFKATLSSSTQNTVELGIKIKALYHLYLIALVCFVSF